MEYIVMPFDCENCGAELEAHVEAIPKSVEWQYSARGHHLAKCPKCGEKQGGESGFPARVLKTVERVSRSG